MIAVLLFLSFLEPLLYSAGILGFTAVLLLHRRIAGSSELPDGLFALMAIWFLFAILAVMGPTFVNQHYGRNVDSFKFIFMGFAFIAGTVLAENERSAKLAVSAFIVSLTAVWGTIYLTGAEFSQSRTIYPPDRNLSAAMVALMLPLLILRFSGLPRLLLLLSAIGLSIFVQSRAMLAISVVALAVSPEFIRYRKGILVLAVPLVAAILFAKALSLNNFSDQLRLQIVGTSLNFGLSQGLHAFNLGETYFTDFLNIYPIYRGLEIQHAHNLVLQIWVAYGLVPVAVFLLWFALMLRRAWLVRSPVFLLQLGVFILFSMIESMITDIRSIGTVMLMLGYGYAQVPAPRRSSLAKPKPRQKA